jgi:MFS family permease
MNDQHTDYRRNFASLASDWVCFVTGMAFISYTSVIPSFINQLTDFAPLIGLATTIPNGVWLLPQIIAANYVGSKERKKPWIITLALIARPAYLILGITTLVVGNTSPLLLLVVFFAAEAIFSSLDGLGTVAWLDVLRKSIPPQKRGRFYGTAQALSGLFSVAAGAIVARVLGPGGPPFPQNYGVVFLSCFALMMISLVAFLFLKEPIEDAHREREPWRVYLPRMMQLLRAHEQFRLVNGVRLLTALGGLAIPFYVVHATDVLGLGSESIGLFVSAQVLGGLIASLAMGYLNERSGSKIVTQLTTALNMITPMLALGIHYFPLPEAIAAYGYAMLFLLIGATYAGYMQGFMNFVLEIAPQGETPAYIGLHNTLGGTVIFIAPLLGGWLLESTSYPILFSAAIVGTMTGFALSLTLQEPRRR